MGDTQELFKLMHDEHGLTLFQNEMQLIIEVCKQYHTADKDAVADVPLDQLFMPAAYYCEHKHKCKWQGMHMYQGLTWESPNDATLEWRKWHDKECGGKFIILYKQA